MKRVEVTDAQRAALEAHLDLGRGSPEDYLLGDDKVAWLRKCAALLYMVDPNLRKGDLGLVGRFFTDLRSAIERIARSDLGPIDYDRKINEEFKSAVSNLEGLVECLTVAPASIVTKDGDQKRVNPYFFDVPDKADDRLVFVLMPFTEPWSRRIWESHLKPIVQELELDPTLECKRADDLYGQDVLHDIVSAISAARLVIADITGRNPNVFYELGIAHWMGKRVILITQSVKDVPFDLLRFRHIVYQDNSDGYKKLEVQLRAAIMESLA